MAPTLKTYGNKNTTINRSVDAFNALFAQNLVKRKKTNALKKRKNAYKIRELPVEPCTRALLEDSVPLIVNTNSTFDRLLREDVNDIPQTNLPANVQNQTENKQDGSSQFQEYSNSSISANLEVSKYFDKNAPKQNCMKSGSNLQADFSESMECPQGRQTSVMTRSRSRNSLCFDSSSVITRSQSHNLRPDPLDVSLEVEFVHLQDCNRMKEGTVPSYVCSTPYVPRTRQTQCNNSFFCEEQLLEESMQQIKDWSLKPPDFKASGSKRRKRNFKSDWKLNNTPKVILNRMNACLEKPHNQKELFVKITKLTEGSVSKKLTKSSILLKARDFNRLVDSCGANVSGAISVGDVNQVSIRSVPLEDFENFAKTISESNYFDDLQSCEEVSEVVIDEDVIGDDGRMEQASKPEKARDKFVNKRSRNSGVVTRNQLNKKSASSRNRVVKYVSKRGKNKMGLNKSDSRITRSQAKLDKSIKSDILSTWELVTHDDFHVSTRLPYVTKRNKNFKALTESLPKEVSALTTLDISVDKEKSIQSKKRKHSEESSSPESSCDNWKAPFAGFKKTDNLESPYYRKALKSLEISSQSNGNKKIPLVAKASISTETSNSLNGSIHDLLTSTVGGNLDNTNLSNQSVDRKDEASPRPQCSSSNSQRGEDKSQVNIQFHFKNNMQGKRFSKPRLKFELIDDSSEDEDGETESTHRKLILDISQMSRMQRRKQKSSFAGFSRQSLESSLFKKERQEAEVESNEYYLHSRIMSGEISIGNLNTRRKTVASVDLTNTCDEASLINRTKDGAHVINVSNPTITKIAIREVDTTKIASKKVLDSVDLTEPTAVYNPITMKRGSGRDLRNDSTFLTNNSISVKTQTDDSIDLTKPNNLITTKRGSGNSKTIPSNSISIKRGFRRNENNEVPDQTSLDACGETIDLTDGNDVQIGEKKRMGVSSLLFSDASANLSTNVSSRPNSSDTVLIEDSFATPLLVNRHFIKSGKLWRRSLCNYKRNTFILKMCVQPTEPTCKSDEGPCGCQKCKENKLAELSVCRKSIRLIPDSTPKKRTKRLSAIEKYACRKSYAPNNIQGALEQILEGLSVNTTDETQHLSIEDHGNEIAAPFVTARDIVLRRCGQTEPVPFSECYPQPVLKNCHKIGEGVYGEVFLFRNKMGTTSVMKVIPIEGDLIVNGERQKKFEEILTEIIIAMELSDLRKNKKNSTSGFNEVCSIHCVKGEYPARLLDLWDLYDEDRGSENDCPDVFGPEQLYIVLELTNGGKDLESYVFNNAMQAFSLFQQAACSLAVAEVALQFEHRDLHWGNILISGIDKNKKLTYNLNGRQIDVPSNGVQISIIDFTLSRITFDSVCVYNDLGQDPDLFNAEGDYQFEVYRLMQKCNHNEWQHFEPYTNILWLHYTLDKMITALRYKYPQTKCHNVYIDKLKQLKEHILDFKSVEEFVTQTFV